MSLLKPSILRFKFDNFAKLLSVPGNIVFSEKLPDGHGNYWRLRLKPGGDETDGPAAAEEGDPWVAIFLEHSRGNASVTLRCTFILRDSLGGVWKEWKCKPFCTDVHRNRGTSQFIKRSAILNKEHKILSGNALHIDVMLQIKFETDREPTPSNSVAKKMLQLLESERDADVSFRVETVEFAAHKLILRMNSQILFDLSDQLNDGSPIAIDGITPAVFRAILRYIYGEEVPAPTQHHRDILDAANRFGVVGLKLAMETALVDSMAVTFGNAVDWLIFSDSKACPLLKECALSVCTARAVDIFDHDCFQKLKESPRLMEEFMREVAKASNNNDRFDDGSSTSVNSLRKQLREKGLDIDGSKEMLISRLQGSNKRRRTE
ncbi:hypothetical protein ACHAWF_016525 [Thalassiosira exigua]